MMMMMMMLPLLMVSTVDARRTKIRIQDVQTLTFHAGMLTTSNKNQPVPQIQCSSGCVGDVTQARCKNDGTDDYGEVNWRCTSPIPKGCKFSSTSVSCERYRSPDLDEEDNWIVPGSCAFIFGLSCDRLNEAQEEELALKRRIEQQRREQQHMMLQEVQRSRDQAARDACELIIAGSLYPLNTPVARDDRKGHVSAIACDGTYTVHFEDGAIDSRVNESELNPYVEPMFKYISVTSTTGTPLPQGQRRQRRRSTTSSTGADTYSDAYGTNEANSSMFDNMGGLVVVVGFIVAGIVLFGCSGKKSSRRGRGVNANVDEDPNAHVRSGGSSSHDSSRSTGFIMTAAALAAASAANENQNFLRQRRRPSHMYGHTYDANGAKKRTTRVRDRQGEERQRTSKKEGLAAAARARLEKTKADQERRESARRHEYKTRVEQSQRKITTDTAQLGNQMKRTDHVRDQTEGVAYAKTTFR